MATGWYDVERHSEEIVDFVCTPCMVKQRSRRAERFCETCNKYYCEKCLTFHDEIFTDHDLLGTSEFRNKPVRLLPTERCCYHKNEVLQVYCREHDKVICNTCVTMQHRTCSIVYIPKEIHNLLSSTEAATVKADLATSVTTLRKDAKSGKVKLWKLKEKKNNILESIENQGQVLKRVIDRLVEKSKKDVEEKYDLIEEKMQEEIEKNKNDQTELEEKINQLDIAEKQKNDSQVFVSLKSSQVKMTESKKHQDDFTTWRATVQLEFNFNRDVEAGLKRLTTLGIVTDKYTPVPVQNLQPTLYKVLGQRTLQVCQEKTRCSISGSCQVRDGSFLVTDWYHMKVVHLDASCSKVIDQCQVPGQPYTVCLTGDKEAAVSLPILNTIQFVSLGSKITLTRSLKLGHWCSGLAFSQGELFVSDWNKQVYVYDTAGKLLRTIGNNTLGQNIVLGRTQRIAVSLNGEKLFVTDSDKGLICTDRKGNHVFTYSNTQMQFARDVCTDERGSVFVCGNHSNNVVQLSEDGRQLGVLLRIDRMECRNQILSALIQIIKDFWLPRMT